MEREFSILNQTFLFVQIDEHYVGIPPPLEVTLTNLNDNIGKGFLDDLVKKFGQVDESVVYYHGRTRKHLGLARVVFSTTQAARFCVDKMHLSSVMGNILNVFFDPFGETKGRRCARGARLETLFSRPFVVATSGLAGS